MVKVSLNKIEDKENKKRLFCGFVFQYFFRTPLCFAVASTLPLVVPIPPSAEISLNQSH